MLTLSTLNDLAEELQAKATRIDRNNYMGEVLAAEYRMFLQKNGQAASSLTVNHEDRDYYGPALERFKKEVAPNIEIIVSRHMPKGDLLFMRAPGFMLRPMTGGPYL